MGGTFGLLTPQSAAAIAILHASTIDVRALGDVRRRRRGSRDGAIQIQTIQVVAQVRCRQIAHTLRTHLTMSSESRSGTEVVQCNGTGRIVHVKRTGGRPRCVCVCVCVCVRACGERLWLHFKC